MTAVARCIQSGLPPQWCAHCRVDVAPADEPGTCARCLDRWFPGDLFHTTDIGEEICAACAWAEN